MMGGCVLAGCAQPVASDPDATNEAVKPRVVTVALPHDTDDPAIWLAHLAVIEGEASAPVSWETDRSAFIGRGRDIKDPAAFDYAKFFAWVDLQLPKFMCPRYAEAMASRKRASSWWSAWCGGISSVVLVYAI